MDSLLMLSTVDSQSKRARSVSVISTSFAMLGCRLLAFDEAACWFGDSRVVRTTGYMYGDHAPVVIRCVVDGVKKRQGRVGQEEEVGFSLHFKQDDDFQAGRGRLNLAESVASTRKLVIAFCQYLGIVVLEGPCKLK